MKANWERFWNFSKGFFTFLFVAVLLSLGWYIFLTLVNKPPLETNSIMVMVWASLSLLILTAFPQVLDRIKKLKIGDFEVELQETLRKSTSSNPISPSDLDSPFFHKKGNLRKLKDLVVLAIREPTKTYFLIVNVFELNISTFALAAYLYFLGFVTKSVVVIFVSEPDQQYDHRSLRKSSVIGAVNGEAVLKEIFLRYSNIYRKLVNYSAEFRDDKSDNENDLLNFLRGIDLLWRNSNGGELEDIRLTSNQVIQWFSDSLSTKMISLEFAENDIQIMKICLMSEDDFILVFEGDMIVSVIPLCDYTRIFTSRIMQTD
jgi:hypothetical protein